MDRPLTERAHEVKDPVHGFLTLTGAERTLLDSLPVQRLRHISQLSLSSLVYPGATHRRFEHSLGVMHLAGVAYDALSTAPQRYAGARPLAATDPAYWRRVVRAAALLHDVGHLPFSHAAENLLDGGHDHEALSRALILSPYLAGPLAALELDPADVAGVAVGGTEAGAGPAHPLHGPLHTLIAGDAFGADRADYLLRDAYHSGAQAGSFDARRLLGRLVLLPGQHGGPDVVGVQAGAVQAAEALLTTRDFLYEGLYFHPVRRIYDHHLGEFLRAALGSALLPEGVDGKFSLALDRHLALSDEEVWVALRRAATDQAAPGHSWARRIMTRQHFRLLARSRQAEGQAALAELAGWAVQEFGAAQVVYDPVLRGPGQLDVQVLDDGRVRPAGEVSRLLRELPAVQAAYLFVAPELEAQARAWLLTRQQKR